MVVDRKQIVVVGRVEIVNLSDFIALVDVERFNKLLANVNLRASKLHYMHSGAYNEFRQVRDAY